MTAALVAAVGLVATPIPVSRLVIVVAAVCSVTAAPILLIPAAGVGLIAATRARLQRHESKRRSLAAGRASLAEMTAIGLSGGLGVQSALQLAAESVGGPIGAEATDALRRMRIDGLGSAGSIAGAGTDLYRTIGRAAASGAPLLGPVTRLADQLHADLASARLEAVRRIPVAVLFPLTLLILPGFLLLTVAPALLEAFGRLEV